MTRGEGAEILFEAANAKNRERLLALRPAKGQEGFMESVADCLREAAELALWRPVGICSGGRLIGFSMYGLWEREGRVWLDRFLIDGRFQGRGYGSAALRALLRHIADLYGCRRIYLSVYASNAAAIHLYISQGFSFNGENDENGELVMVKEFAQKL